MRNWVRKRRTGLIDRGASAVEYGLIVAAIAALIVTIVFGFGGVVQNIFSDSCTTIGNESHTSTFDCN
jgi:pilus assembly protein Flp/PilA